MGPPGHPASAQLDRFLDGPLATAEVKGVVRHLLAGCASCGGYLARSLDRGPEPGPAPGPDRRPFSRRGPRAHWASDGGLRQGGGSAGEEPMDRRLAASLWTALEWRVQRDI
jgi:hypothetical protein